MSTSTRPADADARTRVQVDPRGPRFAAALTTLLLAVALLLAPSPATIALFVVQTAVFATGALVGIQHTPYSWLFQAFLRPRLGRPDQLEDAAPPRFAQAVGLGFGVVALLGYAVGADLLGTVATGFALEAAFLNAAFGLCLGCEVYLLLQRAKPSRSGSTATAH